MVVVENKIEGEDVILLVREGGSAVLKDNSNKPLTIPNKDYLLNNKIAYWGDNNQLPFEINEDIAKTPVLSQALYFISKSWISGGLVYGKLTIDDDGKDRLVRKQDKKVDEFLRKNQINTEYLPNAAYHFLTYWKGFTELVRNNEGNEIVGIKSHKSPWCRVGLQDVKNGRIEKVFINAQWEEYERAQSNYTVQIPLIQKGYDPVTILKHRSGTNFMYIVDGVGSIEKYYPKAPWHSIRASKWLKLVQEIPEFKSALMKNQSTIKYHITIHPKYWENRFENWSNLNPAEKQAKKEETYKQIDDCLNGSTNTGKNLWSGYVVDPASGKEIEFIKIEAIDDLLKDGKYIDDSQEGVATILYSLGFDGTLIGSTPAKSLGAGSGSDKREAWNIFITNCKTEQDKIIEPIDFACQYNKFFDEDGEPYTFWFKNYYQHTLDQFTESKRNSQVGK